MVFLLNPPEADKSLRYAQKIILGILYICLWLFFSHAPPGRRPHGPEAWS